MRFHFGEFIVDDASRQVLHGSTAVHVSPKAFDLLVTLIHARPRALAKADLHARLWPKTFVSDASLAMLVAEVRAALGETARQPRSVRTVHRHGYAFQASVRETPTPEGAEQSADPTTGCWLVTASGPIPLVPGENVVGRDPRARIWIDSPSISRRHARILVEGGRATIEDLGSKNGTRARGTGVGTAVPLADGDELRFGSVDATFRAPAAEPTRTDGGS